MIAYTAASAGWHRADFYQRTLEAFVSRMPADPESEAAITTVRQHYEVLLGEQTTGFTDALVRSHWQVRGSSTKHRFLPMPSVRSRVPSPISWLTRCGLRWHANS